MGYDNYKRLQPAVRVCCSADRGRRHTSCLVPILALLREGRPLRSSCRGRSLRDEYANPCRIGFRSALLGLNPGSPAFPTRSTRVSCERAKLEERWKAGWAELNGPGDTYRQLKRPVVGRMFEGYESLRMPLVVCHPLFDVRLATFLWVCRLRRTRSGTTAGSHAGSASRAGADATEDSIGWRSFQSRFSGRQWQPTMNSDLAARRRLC